jgi:hypothetical protein
MVAGFGLPNDRSVVRVHHELPLSRPAVDRAGCVGMTRRLPLPCCCSWIPRRCAAIWPRGG